MSSSENSTNDDYEVLPAVKDLNLPLGIKCMEVNVQEVDEAVRQFNQKVADITGPSWKFPQISLEKLDVHHAMSSFRAHESLSDQQLYVELMELLIDRLYYALVTSFEFVSGLETLFLNSGKKSSKTPIMSKKATFGIGKKRPWDPLEIGKKSLNKSPRPFHAANIGVLVRQFSMKIMGLENIVLNNNHFLKKTTTADDVLRKSNSFTLRHSEVQTDKSMQDGCDSCFIAQNILKIVADMVTSTLHTFNQPNSKISETRLKLRKESLSITQRGTLLRWLQSLQEDCETICNCATLVLDSDFTNREELTNLKGLVEMKDVDHKKKMQSIQDTMEKLKEDLKEEKESRTRISRLKDSAVLKSSEMEKMLQLKIKQCDKLSQEREALQRSFNIAEELNLQIKSNLARSTTELEKFKKDYIMEDQKNEKLNLQIRSLSTELAKAGQEILKLKEVGDKSESFAEENNELKHQVKRLKDIVKIFESRSEDIEKAVHERDIKIKRLEADLQKSQSKIDVLTLYPDLNGPINTPIKTSESSCVETMEMQVKSNEIRMEILRAQSERLATTVNKLKAHMKTKSKTSITDS